MPTLRIFLFILLVTLVQSKTRKRTMRYKTWKEGNHPLLANDVAFYLEIQKNAHVKS